MKFCTVNQSLLFQANYDSKKLPQDLFKGAISKLKVLPVNQLYLVGSENGNVVMFD